MSGACSDRNTRCGLRRFTRSFWIVQSASLQLISLHVALSSSLCRCRAGDVMRVPRNKAPWTWVHDGQSCSVIECPAPALPGHGEARKSAVSPLADVRVLHPCSRVNWPSLLDDDGRRALHEQDQLLQRSEEHTSELQSLMRISYAV